MAMARSWLRSLLIACGAALSLAAGPAASAKQPELWFSGADDITQKGFDHRRLFDDPAAWPKGAKRVAVFNLPIRHLTQLPPDVARHQLAWLRGHGIKLSVTLPAVGTDKHVCGNGVEGMIWPHEAALAVKHLKELGAEVDYFTLDVPLTAAHISKKPNACHFSVQETATRVAATVGELKAGYPSARIMDAEVPTGIPQQEWLSLLTEYLDAFRRTTGAELDGLSMDIWWKFDWRSRAQETVRILSTRGIRAGVILDSVGRNDMPAAAWIADSRNNACMFRRDGLQLDYVLVANWLDMQVPNVPESDPNTLTGLLNWLADGPTCG